MSANQNIVIKDKNLISSLVGLTPKADVKMKLEHLGGEKLDQNHQHGRHDIEDCTEMMDRSDDKEQDGSTNIELLRFEEANLKSKDEAVKDIIDKASTHTITSARDHQKSTISKLDNLDLTVNIKSIESLSSGGNKIQVIESVARRILEAVLSSMMDFGTLAVNLILCNGSLQNEINRVTELLTSQVKNVELLKERATQLKPEQVPSNVIESRQEMKRDKIMKAVIYLHYRFTYANNLPKSGNGDSDAALEQMYSEFKVSNWTAESIYYFDITDGDLENFNNFISQSEDFFQGIKNELVPRKNLVSRNGPLPGVQSLMTYEHFLEKDIARISEMIKYETNQIVVREYDKYMKKKAEYDRCVLAVAESQTVSNKMTSLSTVLTTYSLIISRLTMKLKTALAPFPDIISKMQNIIQLPNGDVISNPFDSNSLVGMIAIFYKEYAKANLVSFKHRLLEVLNFRLRKDQMDDPSIGGQIIIQKIYTWKSMKLFQFFTEDIFWTVSFLLMYHPESDIYKKCLEHSMDYIHKTSDEALISMMRVSNVGSVHSGSSAFDKRLLFAGMPIFSNLYEWVHNVYKSSQDYNKKQLDNGGGAKGPNNGNYTSSAGKPSSSSTNPTSHKNYGSVAFVAKEKTAMMMKQLDPEPFDREVFRKEMYYVLDQNGNRVLYTATVNACTLCLSNNKHPRPICFVGNCFKCNYYGHKERDCHNVRRPET